MANERIFKLKLPREWPEKSYIDDIIIGPLQLKCLIVNMRESDFTIYRQAIAALSNAQFDQLIDMCKASQKPRPLDCMGHYSIQAITVFTITTFLDEHSHVLAEDELARARVDLQEKEQDLEQCKMHVHNLEQRLSMLK